MDSRAVNAPSEPTQQPTMSAGSAQAPPVTAASVIGMIHTTVTTRLSELMERIVGPYRELATDVSNHVDAIGETLISDCDIDRDESNDALSSVEMRTSEVKLLDQLRTNVPGAYALALRAAEQVWQAPPVGRRALSVRLARDVYDQITERYSRTSKT